MAGRKVNPNPRILMERAIEVMRRSLQERRNDDHKTPLVGAVILKSDGTIETAHRGEIRDGDHAEYTLLERKNRNNPLDGSILFATLEPCAPGARNHPKLSCAERIVLARIKEVWVGIEDPYPTVDRKGIKHLQNNGVTVHMFDRDLQDVIRDLNKGFIEHANERARAVAEAEPDQVILSELEAPADRTHLREFSTEALNLFREKAAITAALDSPEFWRVMEQLGLVRHQGDSLVPSGFGYLLFGTNPRLVMQQAGVLARIEYPSGTPERQEFDQPLVLIPDLLEKWLRDKLPNVFRRDRMSREQIPPVPFELVREGMVNALVHRDYDLAGAKIQIIVDDDTVRILSPGRPPEPVTLEKMQSFDAPMLSRNPIIHYVFARMKYAEEQGIGIGDMRRIAERAGLPLPRYTWKDPYLVLTVYRHVEAAKSDPGARSLSGDDAAAWQYVSTKTKFARRDLMEALGFDARKTQRVLKKLVDAGLVRQIGAGPATRFEVIPK